MFGSYLLEMIKVLMAGGAPGGGRLAPHSFEYGVRGKSDGFEHYFLGGRERKAGGRGCRR
jgi:hypothetical protein